MQEAPRILVVDPHPDDESIYLGGTLSRYSSLGANIHLLVLTNGEKGKIPLLDRQGRIIGQRGVKPEEEVWLAGLRQRECIRAADILGIRSVEFLGAKNLGLDERLIPSLERSIKIFDPHVVISFNEAGTTAPHNSDHSWSGIATFAAVKSVLEGYYGDLKSGMTCSVSKRASSFRRLLTYTMPRVENYLDEWAELISPPDYLTSVDVSCFLNRKKSASFSMEMQRHLIEFFNRVGVLDLGTEHFQERISLGVSCKGRDDILYGLEKDCLELNIASFPDESSWYRSTSEGYYSILSRRCALAGSSVKVA